MTQSPDTLRLYDLRGIEGDGTAAAGQATTVVAVALAWLRDRSAVVLPVATLQLSADERSALALSHRARGEDTPGRWCPEAVHSAASASQLKERPMDIAGFRRQFPITRSRAYLFSGALAPQAEPVRVAWEAWSRSWGEDPNAVYTGEALIGSADALRGSFARLIGADPAGVAITDNTCRAASIAIRVLAERPGGNVVVDSGTYPSSVYPWYARGDREVRVVATDGVDDAAAALAERIDVDTVAVCITHVAPFTGRRHDLAAIAAVAHAHGAALVVDAAQSTGVVPIDVVGDGVDVLVTTAMKWLLGPPGVGFLYLAPSVLANAPVLDVGYLGLDVALGDWPVHALPSILADARRYELGLPNLPGMFAARAGIDLLLEVGVERIFARVEELVTRCLEGLTERRADILTPLDPARRAGVIAFGHADAKRVFDVCRSHAVDVGAIGSVRVDPHGFNDEDDIDRFLGCLDRVSTGP